MDPSLIVVGAAFLIFIFAVRKIVSFIFGIISIALAAAAFPVVSSYVGINFPLTMNNFLLLFSIGIALYFALSLTKIIFKIFRK